MKRVSFAKLLVLLAALAALTSVGCNKNASSKQVTIIPQGTNFVLEVKVDQFMQDADIAGIFNAAPKDKDTPATLDTVLDKVADESGINLRMLSTILFFSSGKDGPFNAGFGDSGAAIITGSFQQDKFVAGIGKSMDQSLTPSDYKDYTIYTSQDQAEGLSFLGDQQAVIGTMQAVKDVIDVKRGDKPAFTGQTADTYNKLGDSLIKLVATLPPDVMEGAREELPPELPSSIADLLDINVAGVSIVKDGQSFIFQVKLLYPSDRAAAGAGNAFKALKLVAPGLPEETGSIATLLPLLDQASASAKGPFLNIKLTLSTTEASDLIKSMGPAH